MTFPLGAPPLHDIRSTHRGQCTEHRHLNECGVDFAQKQFVIVFRDSMSKLIHPAFFRLFFLPWLVTWVLITPLFHIHTLDIQEDRSFFKLFLVHTVFSPDLPGEYSPQSTVHQAGTPNNQGTFSTHFAHYSEESFSLISEDDSKSEKGIEAVLQARFSPLKHFRLKSGRYVIPNLVSPHLMLLASSASLRAPPSVSSQGCPLVCSRYYAIIQGGIHV